MNKLTKEFYRTPATELARQLLGKIFVRHAEDGIIASGRIVEVEAYVGLHDPASHAYRGKTPRNEVMFRTGGYLYVYFTYGMYHCCNIVAGEEGTAEAVLIRGLEPAEGIEWMSLNRFKTTDADGKSIRNLTNGPGKLCRALDITLKDNGTDLTEDRIYLLDAPEVEQHLVATSGRIGISRATELQWRFYLKGNPYVSRP